MDREWNVPSAEPSHRVLPFTVRCWELDVRCWMFEARSADTSSMFNLIFGLGARRLGLPSPAGRVIVRAA